MSGTIKTNNKMGEFKDDEFQKLKDILELPKSEINTDDIYNMKMWCKSLISKLERSRDDIKKKEDQIYELRIKLSESIAKLQKVVQTIKDA